MLSLSISLVIESQNKVAMPSLKGAYRNFYKQNSYYDFTMPIPYNHFFLSQMIHWKLFPLDYEAHSLFLLNQ